MSKNVEKIILWGYDDGVLGQPDHVEFDMYVHKVGPIEESFMVSVSGNFFLFLHTSPNFQLNCISNKY